MVEALIDYERGIEGLKEEANGVVKRLGKFQLLQRLLDMLKMKKIEGGSKM